MKIPDFIIEFLKSVHDISFGYNSIKFLSADNVAASQIGYSIDEKGILLTGENTGAWNEDWIVIAKDSFDDPIFVDASTPDGFVMVAAEDEEGWEEIEIADNLKKFKEIIDIIKDFTAGREDHTLLKANPLGDKERQAALTTIRKHNADSETWYWEDFLEKQ